MRVPFAAVIAALLLPGALAAQERLISDPWTQIVDSAAVLQALGMLPAGPDTARTARIFAVRFDSAGRPDSVRASFPDRVPDAYELAVTRGLQAGMRASGRPLQQAYLLIETGPSPRVEQVDLYVSAPRFLNRAAVVRALQHATGALVRRDTTLYGRRLGVVVRMRVDTDSATSGFTLVQPSGVAAADSAAIAVAAAFRFMPGTVEGVPVRIWVTQPIDIVLPERPAVDGERRREEARQRRPGS
jgi:TonB family protein